MKAKHRLFSRTALGGITGLLVVALAHQGAWGSPTEQESSVMVQSTAGDAERPGKSGGEPSMGVTSVTQFTTHADYPHLSHDNPGYVHAKGYWRNVNSKATTANVDVTLQALTGNGWRTVGFLSQNKRAENIYGTGEKVIVPLKCVDARPYYYRTITDVDLIGYVDDNSVAIAERPGTLNCGFAW